MLPALERRLVQKEEARQYRIKMFKLAFVSILALVFLGKMLF